jgi:hypothetical protein
MMYTEIIACYEATRQAVWLKKFISGHRVVDSIEKALKIYCDNEPAYNTPITTRRVMLGSTSQH